MRGTSDTALRRARFALLAVLLLALATATLLSGCLPGKASSSSSHVTEDGKPIVTVSMYNDSSFPEWRAYVEQQCPDVYIDWTNNRNTFSNVIYGAKHGDMPDLVCIRKYESDSARDLEPYLADLSGLDLAGRYSAESLVPFRIGDKQCWLPGPGTVEGLFANTDVFERYGIALPTDMASFVSACGQLREHGVDPFAVDCTTGYGAVAMLQGFGSAGYLGTSDGLSYLASFESGQATQVDADGFSSIFDTLRSLKDAGILTSECLTSSDQQLTSELLAGQVAIGRASSDQLSSQASQYHFSALPFFGQTSDDSRLLSYPVFSVALSKEASADAARDAACTEVLSAMLSGGAQEKLDYNTAGLVSYTKGITLALQPSMESVRPLIEGGKVSIRQINSNSFSAVPAVMRALIADGASNEALLDTLDAGLFKTTEPTVVGTSSVEAGISLDQHLCSPAGSVLAQSVRSQAGTDFSVIDSREAASPIYKGAYTDLDVAALVVDGNVYVGTLSTAQLRELLASCIHYSTTFPAGAPEPYLDYPALAGMTVRMEKTGQIDGIEGVDGGVVPEEGSHSVAVSARVYSALSANKSGLAALFSKGDLTLSKCLGNELASASGLPKAGEYYVIS
ncbi:MAG: hypothetical protein WAY93_05770 [Atopobiaceae bacterium]|jgi:hypothetical protein|nr:extracellular solute-binding protein [Atopobiaceae bacterium]